MKVVNLLLFVFMSLNSCIGDLLRRKKLENQVIPIIRGIRWSGMETENYCFYGLWKHSMEFYLDLIREYEINTIYVPLSVENVYYKSQFTPFPSQVYKDVQFSNQTILEILDSLFIKTNRKKMNVILGIDRLHNMFESSDWIESPLYNISIVLKTHEILFERYRNFSNFKGLNLYNSPATENSTVWINFVNQSLQLNERFFLEGLDHGINMQYIKNTTLSTPNVKYFPQIIDKNFNQHESKSLVFDLYNEWNNNFAFINPKDVVINKLLTKDAYYMNYFAIFCNEKLFNNIIIWELSHNPYFGILEDDWTTIKQYRIALMDKIQ